MLRAAVVYGLALAAFALLLGWIEASRALRSIDTDIYIGFLAILFTALGLWIGVRLTAQRHDGPFIPNESAALALGISLRENEVLVLLAAGHSNKEIARLLAISPNTVKTHVASILAKLDAKRRTQAIRNAQAIGIIP
jgi:DNA-binding CsgD family transcriptional regulator